MYMCKQDLFFIDRCKQEFGIIKLKGARGHFGTLNPSFFDLSVLKEFGFQYDTISLF